MKSRISVLAVALLAVFLWGSSASADITFSGDPGTTPDDWTQTFNESGVGTFNSIAAFLETPGVLFTNPGMTGFTNGWASTANINSQYNLASGADTTNTNFNANFAPLGSVPFVMDLYAFLDGNIVDAGKASWDGVPSQGINGWTMTGFTDNQAAYKAENTAPTPEPTSLLLLGSGLVGLAKLVRKKIA